jgi:DHA3 family macrolide efflux protein-like MFS transporter
LTALLAIVPLLFVEIPQPDAPAARGIGWRPVIQETGEGFRYLWNWHGLFVMLVTVSLIPLVNTPAWSLIPLLVRDHFGGGPAEWGWFSVARNAGSVLGGLLMSTWGGFRRRTATMLGGLVILGLINFVRGLVPPHAYWLFLVAAFVSGPPATMFFAALKAVLQSIVPPEMQGRVFATKDSLFSAMGPLGLAVLGPLGGTIGTQTLFLLSGVLFLLVALAWALTPSVRNMEQGPPDRAGTAASVVASAKRPSCPAGRRY